MERTLDHAENVTGNGRIPKNRFFGKTNRSLTMNARFTKLALLAAMAGGVHLAQAEEPPAGNLLVQQSARRLAAYRSVEARLRVTTEVLGQPLVGSGGYAQLASTGGLLLRLELTVQAGGRASSVKQICNGPNLWEHWRIDGQEKLHHVDLRRVEAELARAPAQPGASMTGQLAHGGLPKLLRQLGSFFDFGDAPAVGQRIGTQAGWVIRGIWKREELERLAPHAVQADKVDFRSLAPHMPHAVELWIGAGDRFPYRVTYLRQDGEEPALRPVVSLEFYDVALDLPMNPSQFHYQQPDNVRVADRTDRFLQSLGIARRDTTPQR